MAKRSINIYSIALAGITGLSFAGVSVLAYLRFQHPQEFADTSVGMTYPEFGDEKTKKWGVYGSGLYNSIPDFFKNLIDTSDFAERIEENKKRRQQQIQQSIEDLRPKK